MYLLVRGYCTVIAASVQCDVDGISKRSHHANILTGPRFFQPLGESPRDERMPSSHSRLAFVGGPPALGEDQRRQHSERQWLDRYTHPTDEREREEPPRGVEPLQPGFEGREPLSVLSRTSRFCPLVMRVSGEGDYLPR
jgi:hypothetical protein